MSNQIKKSSQTNELEVIQKISAWLDNQPFIIFAILFGSFVKGRGQNHSDIDLAIELDKQMTAETKLQLLQSLGEITDRSIDLVDLKTVGEPLLNQIILYGKQLKGSQQQLINLSIKNVNMMQDFVPYIERTLKERRKRLLQNG